ncbi:MAG: MerR family transcriptional regulator [Candidatus Omnitrophica bacterium]|nr:MerR family transcriptional regulator [Candidatus Omnitrophota bacterium]
MNTIYLLKDLAVRTGLSAYTIKYYLKLGLIKEIGRSPGTNFRYFDDSTISALENIRSLRKDKLTLKQINKKINTGAII